MDCVGAAQAELARSGRPGADGPADCATEGAARCGQGEGVAALGEARRDATARGSARAPWLRRGVGAALVMHGAGLGLGIPDHSGGRIELTPEGKIQASFGFEEFGQGLYAALTLMLQDFFGCAAEDIRIVIGDTDRVPSSGSSTASRATTMMWRALQRLKPPSCRRCCSRRLQLAASQPKSWQPAQAGFIARAMNREAGCDVCGGLLRQQRSRSSRIRSSTTRRRRKGWCGAHYLYSYASAIVEVEVNMLTGRVKVLQTDHVIAAGPVINPMGFLGQIEGGSVMAWDIR